MKTQKYWIRFTLLALLPIVMGLAIGLLIVKMGHHNCVDKSQLSRCGEDLFQAREALDAFERDQLLVEILQKSQLAAQRDVNKLEGKLAKKHDHWTATIVDSIVNATVAKITSSFSPAVSDSTIADVSKILTEFYINEATALGWNAKLWLKGKSEKEEENQYVQSLNLQFEETKLQLREVKAALQRTKEELKEKEGEITALSVRLASKNCPPCPTTYCDEKACKEWVLAGKLISQIAQIEIAKADLEEIDRLINWLGYGKLRQWLESRAADYEKQLIALQVELREKTSNLASNPQTKSSK